MDKKKTSRKRHPEVKHRVVHRRPAESPRSKVERMLGKKLLRGEIPVVRPGDFPTCPVPPTHVRNFDECCKDFASGKMSENEVVTRVTEMLKTMKKPEPHSSGQSSEAIKTAGDGTNEL